MIIRALIVDDEQSCRDSLRNILQNYCEEVEITDTSDSVEDAYAKILLTKPDVVFLDIMMPPSDGFALLNKFKSADFEVVFTTAYDEFAIQAIKHSAMDYILKPVNVSEIVNAVARIKEKKSARQQQKQPIQRIALPTKESIQFIEPSLIIHAESEAGHKTIFYLKNGKQMLINKDLAEYEALLLPYGFFRPHRSHIINCLEVKEYVPDRSGGCAIMTDGKIVPVGLKRKDEFLALFKAN
jgi:two-component system LytT family response regulator